mmetsp:Transcript_33249/g.88362  ORF Transcript_33249/g.88362 Transcript_33249/m.88362 type:complete len:106 (-) Transcript_33249:1579-1896(-)
MSSREMMSETVGEFKNMLQENNNSLVDSLNASIDQKIDKLRNEILERLQTLGAMQSSFDMSGISANESSSGPPMQPSKKQKIGSSDRASSVPSARSNGGHQAGRV